MSTKLMNQVKKLLLVLSITGSFYVRATEPGTTKSPEAILAEACDAALNDQLNLNKDQAALNEQLRIAAGVKQERINQLEAEKGAWYNNTPLMLFIGLTAGLVAGGVIAK